MNTGVGQSGREGSARIYQFPVGGRAALSGRRYGETRTSLDAMAQAVPTSICSGSWYHDEAIKDSKPAWER